MGKRELLGRLREIADVNQCDLNSKDGRQKLVDYLLNFTVDKPEDLVNDKILDESYHELEKIDGVKSLMGVADLSFAGLSSYIDANVTDLASARSYLKKMSRVVLYLLKRDLAE